MQTIPSVHIGGKKFCWGTRTYVMGVLNMTPDSFSGDGFGDNIEAAVERVLSMEKEGADIIDIGGESTRPPGITYGAGAEKVSSEEELRRVIPVIKRLKPVLTIPISIDTYKADVAERAIAAGASLINDVWGLRRDPDLARVAAERGVLIVLAHNKKEHEYTDLLAEVADGLRESAAAAIAAGVPEAHIILDPGIGFGKIAEHNLEILRHLDSIKNAFPYPLLVGTSRKNFIGLVLGGLAPEDRVEGTAATVSTAVMKGADIVRVHDMHEMARVARMTDAIVRGWVREK